MGIHPLKIAEGYELACAAATANLDAISARFEFDPQDPEPLIRTCMTTLSSKVVGRLKRPMAEMCVKAVLSVADLERRDVNLDLIKVEGKVGAQMEDARLVEGIVIDKDFSHPQVGPCCVCVVGGGAGLCQHNQSKHKTKTTTPHPTNHTTQQTTQQHNQTTDAERAQGRQDRDSHVPLRAAQAQDQAQGRDRHGREV
jgi:chaperonin GroEL (HSP60 family)